LITDSVSPTQEYKAFGPNSLGAAVPVAGSEPSVQFTPDLSTTVPLTTAVTMHVGPKNDFRPSANARVPPQAAPEGVSDVIVMLVISTYFFCAARMNWQAGATGRFVDVGGSPNETVSEIVVGVVPDGQLPELDVGTYPVKVIT
jgi:hypothetical protein